MIYDTIQYDTIQYNVPLLQQALLVCAQVELVHDLAHALESLRGRASPVSAITFANPVSYFEQKQACSPEHP